MENLDSIYTDLIMEHSTSTKNRREIENETSCMLGHNPNCGDKITLHAKVENGIVADLSFSGSGCAISQSSTDIMIDLLKGKTLDEAKQIINTFLSMIKREKLTREQLKLLRDARMFENISSMPSRVKCATLSWHTLEKLLDELNK